MGDWVSVASPTMPSPGPDSVTLCDEGIDKHTPGARVMVAWVVMAGCGGGGGGGEGG